MTSRNHPAEVAPAVRARNFEEVTQCFTDAQAAAEAERCLLCKNPKCVSGCPVGVPIPDFIRALQEGDRAAARALVLEANALAAICGRVCPQENQCEGVCIRGIKSDPVAIGALERYAATCAALAEQDAATVPQAQRGGLRSLSTVRREVRCAGDKLVGDSFHALPDAMWSPSAPTCAVIGAGPAGLTCAGELARRGANVTIFEALHTPGGVLAYGIPPFRLPRDVLNAEINRLTALGVKIKTDVVAGKAVDALELIEEGFKTVFVAIGAGLPTMMNVPGENAVGVYSANEFLTRANLMNAGRESTDAHAFLRTPILKSAKTIVVGGGNVAMDAARVALRLGAEVTILYRRTRDELPARQEEIRHAEEEGIVFSFLESPLEVCKDEAGRACGVRSQKNELGEPDDQGRRRPVPIAGAETVFDCDTVIVAIGTRPQPLAPDVVPGAKLGRHGIIDVDPATGATSIPHIYAGGDVATGAATVILAMGAGKRAAASMAAEMGI